MSGQEWIELLNLIPEDQHSALNVMCRSGVELSIDVILRTETSFLVYRGRMVGTTDDGRVFFTPYSEITSLYLNRFMKENEVEAFFDSADQAADALAAQKQLDDDEAAFLSTPHTTVPPPPPAPSPFPPIMTKSSGMVPRIPPGMLPKPSVVATSGAPAGPKGPSFMPPPPPVVAPDSAAKGSILDRLRAQRSGPPARKS